MDLRLISRNLELNSEAEGQIRRKLNRLERHLAGTSEAVLEISRTTARAQGERVVAQMTIKVSGFTLRGQETGVNLFAAIDALTDVMDRQIRKYKGKVYRSAQAKKSAKADVVQQSRSDDDSEEEPDDAILADIGQVVRTKRFKMKPMAVEDAVMEMELLGHDFFLFVNGETETHSVVYRRSDGGYGMIEPDQA